MKERLVGAIVLVLVGAWLIPWVLDGPENPVEPNASSLQLPAVEEPVPMRTQTLRLGGPEESPPERSEPAPVVAAASPPATPAPAVSASNAVEGPEPEAASAAVVAATPAAAAEPPAPAPDEPRQATTTTSPPRATAQSAAPARTQASAPPTSSSGDWVVQLGSFGEEANARRLADRVKTFGYQAQISTYRTGGRAMYRVRVGPYASRNQADAAASALSAHGVVAQVVTAD